MDDWARDQNLIQQIWDEASRIFDHAYERKHSDHGNIDAPLQKLYHQGKADAMRVILAILRQSPQFKGENLGRLCKELGAVHDNSTDKT